MRTKDAFLALVRAGMWEKGESVSCGGLAVLNSEVLRLAKEQSIVGLVAAGMEKLPTGIVPLTEKLTLLGKCQLIEQRNVEGSEDQGDRIRGTGTFIHTFGTIYSLKNRYPCVA